MEMENFKVRAYIFSAAALRIPVLWPTRAGQPVQNLVGPTRQLEAMCTLLIPKRVIWHGLEIRPVWQGFRVLLPEFRSTVDPWPVLCGTVILGCFNMAR